MTPAQMRVVFFHRKRFSGGYSIESLFANIRSCLSSQIVCSAKELRFESKGLWKRIFIALEAAFNQGDMNHVTGDIHFIAILLKKKRTILTIHDLGFMSHPNRIARWILKIFWISWPVRRSGLVTVISNATKIELLKYVHPKYESKIHVIYNPVRDMFKSMPKEFNDIKPVILQIGTKYNKNLRRLVHALEGITCKLEIVGQLSPSIEAELSRCKIDYAVSGGLTDEEIVEKYRASDIVSFVSTNEGFGFPIIEANAVGRVVVTSNISSMPEIAGNSAHLVDPFDVISIRDGFLKVIQDKNYRERLILNGFENVKRFNVKSISGQYLELYHSVVT